jgi:hypothetical protein
VVECAGLEIRYTVIPYRGFESLLLRQYKKPRAAGFFHLDTSIQVLQNSQLITMKLLKLMALIALTASVLSGCTLLAIADAAGSAVVYGVKTTVNVLDAVTPDIVNKKK